jgi:adenylosuccinate synthase
MQQDWQVPRVDIVLGGQLGDEGKGRLIDILATDYDIVARCNSGGNAGHKVVVEGYTYAFHMVPSGILNPNTTAVIGNGCVINLEDLRKEIETIQLVDSSNPATQNIALRLLISNRAHIVLPIHKIVDSARENAKSVVGSSIGTTKQGMGPVYATKALRVGLRMCDLFLTHKELLPKVKLLLDELASLSHSSTTSQSINIDTLPTGEEITTMLLEHATYYKPMICDTVSYLNQALTQSNRLSTRQTNKPIKILVEGAQAALLDVDFGVYPYCTSTTCTIGAICTGLGIPPHYITGINYVIKTYTTRVGNGSFPTELPTDEPKSPGSQLQCIGHEYGTTTGRTRRCGWLDIPMIKWALMVNGTPSRAARICMTKLDVLDTFPEIKIATKYYLPSTNKSQPADYSFDILEEQTGFPASLEDLARVSIVYETFPGWLQPTTHIREYEDLPTAAKTYISRIEELLGIPIYWIGVGVSRDAMIIKSSN